MNKIINYIKEAKKELDKVIFPTITEIRQSLVAVFLVVSVITIFLGLVDLSMSGILKVVL
jgi:preprotein translocase subunit SecE